MFKEENKALLNKYLDELKEHRVYVLAIGALIAFVFLFILLQNKPIPLVWQAVPNNLLFAIQYSNEHEQTSLQASLQKSLKDDISTITSLKIFNHWNAIVEAIAIYESYQPEETLVALHTNSNNEISPLFIWRFNEEKVALLSLILANKTNVVKTRKYRGKSIFTIPLNKKVFNVYRHKDLLIGSQSPVLLEASIRSLSESKKEFSQEDLPQTKPEDFYLTLNRSMLKQWFSTHFVKSPFATIQSEEKQFDPLVFNLQKEGNVITLTGKQQVISETWLSQEQEEILALDEIVFFSRQPVKKKSNNEKLAERRTLLEKRFGLEFEKVFANFKGEINSILFKRKDAYQLGKMFKIALKDSAEVAKQLALLHPKIPINREGFTRIQQPNFPYVLFSEGLIENPLTEISLQDFSASFYQIKNEELMLANFEPHLSDQDSLFQPFYQNDVQLLLKWRDLLPYFATKMDQSYQKSLAEVFEIVDNGFVLTSGKGAFGQLHIKESAKINLEPDTLFEIELPRNVREKIYQVKNHNTQGKEFLWQDAKSRLVLLSDTGEILWRKAVWQYAVSDVYQVDVYNNRKLQYVFASEGRIHNYDRLGRTVNGFPIALPTYFEAKFLCPVRWKNEKEQRFLVGGNVPGSDEVGAIYLYNRYGGISRGWRPRKMEAALACAPKVVRFKGKDLVLVLLSNGSFYVLDKNGRVQKGFPLITNMICSNDFTISGTAENPIVNFISEGGTIISLNLEGKLVKRQSMNSRAAHIYYSLVSNQQSLGEYVVAVQEDRKLSIKDADLQNLFTYEFDEVSKKEIAYYDFGFGKEVLLLFSPKNKTSVLVNRYGEVIIEHLPLSQIKPVLNYDILTQKYNLLVENNGEMCSIEW